MRRLWAYSESTPSLAAGLGAAGGRPISPMSAHAPRLAIYSARRHGCGCIARSVSTTRRWRAPRNFRTSLARSAALRAAQSLARPIGHHRCRPRYGHVFWSRQNSVPWRRLRTTICRRGRNARRDNDADPSAPAGRLVEFGGGVTPSRALAVIRRQMPHELAHVGER